MGLIKLNAKQLKIVDWCQANISPRTYYMAFNKGVKVGGLGWEIVTSNNVLTAYIEDEKMHTFFALSFENSK